MSDKKVVLVSGNFNVLHPGHLRLFRFASDCGDRLVVAVASDKIAGSSAHIPESLRLEGVKSNNWVDECFIMDEPINELIGRLQPAVVVKGKEHMSQPNLEQEAVELYGGKLIFSSGESTFSSIDLLRKEFYETTPSDINLPDSYLERHNISRQRLAELVKQISSLKICVIGDLIIDEYITCEPLGMSQEEPTIVVTPIDSTRFVGGAGIVAAHAAGLGASVEFVTITGSDPLKVFVEESFKDLNVNLHLVEDVSRPTTLKQRFRSKGKSLLRVSHLHQTAISAELQKVVINQCKSILPFVDLLVFSDFNYGCLPQDVVDKVTDIANSEGVMLVADSQSSSQMGDVARFRNMDLITPTEREARVSTRNSEDGLVVLAEQLKNKSLARNILLKIGEEGLLIHADTEDKNKWLTDRISALNLSPRDVAGAGDSLLIVAALVLKCGANIWEAACLGSIAAAIQVGRVGNTPLQIEELLSELT